jgi:hypothetical protein
MEKNGILSSPNHSGKREVLLPDDWFFLTYFHSLFILLIAAAILAIGTLKGEHDM